MNSEVLYNKKDLKIATDIQALQIKIEHLTTDISEIKTDMHAGFDDLKKSFKSFAHEGRRDIVVIQNKIEKMEAEITDLKNKQFKIVIICSLVGMLIGGGFTFYEKIHDLFIL